MSPSYSLTLNANTSGAGFNGGNIDLYGTYTKSTLSAYAVTANSTGGAGGTAGTISLPAVTTGASSTGGAQSYTGGIITLNGNMTTNRGALTLAGDTQLAANVTIDTWQHLSNSQTGTAGAVTISGTGISGTAAGRTLTINTNTDTSSGYYNPPTNTLSWTQSGGNVSLVSGTSGGYALGTITVDTSVAGTYNTGTSGALTLNGVTTTGNQTYTNAATTLSGSVTSGGTVRFNTVTSGSSVSGSGVITASNLLLNGLSTTYTLNTGTGHKVSTLAATGATNLLFLNDDVALTIGTISSVSGISASGLISVLDKSADITIAQNIVTTDTTNSAVIMNAGSSSSAGTSSGGNILISGSPTITVGSGGRVTLFSGSVSGSTGLTAFVGSGSGHFRYNSDETTTNYSTALSSGTYAIYREQPIITVTAQDDSITYNGTVYSGGNGVSRTGFVNGEDASVLTGTLSYGGTSQSAQNVGAYSIVPSGYSNGLGYGFSYVNGELSIARREVIVTADGKVKTAGQADPALTYVAETQTGSRGLMTGDSLVGQLVRTSGDSAGMYPILQGTLNNVNNGNYDIDYVSGIFTVLAKPATVPLETAVKVTQSTVGVISTPVNAPILVSSMQPSRVSTVTSSGLTLVPVSANAVISPKGDVAGGKNKSTAETPAVSTNSVNTNGNMFMPVFVVSGGINVSSGTLGAILDQRQSP